MFSSLPNALHRNIEKEVDVLRWKKEKPLWMKHLSGEVVAQEKKIESDFDGITLAGRIDCLMRENGGKYIIVDYKTSSRPYDKAKAEKYYSLQMHAYSWLLEQKGFSPVKEAVLIFFTPSIGEGCEHRYDSIKIPFQVHTVHMSVSPARAREVLERVREVVIQEHEPAPSPQCDYCAFAGALR
jgi:RecB family exonuclease